MLRGDLQIAADVVGRQLFDIARIFDGDVIAYPEAIRIFLMPFSSRARR
jgi:hypothetical protein